MRDKDHPGAEPPATLELIEAAFIAAWRAGNRVRAEAGLLPVNLVFGDLPLHAEDLASGSGDGSDEGRDQRGQRQSSGETDTHDGSPRMGVDAANSTPRVIGVNVNDGSAHDRAMAWAEGYTDGFEDGRVAERTLIRKVVLAKVEDLGTRKHNSPGQLWQELDTEMLALLAEPR